MGGDRRGWDKLVRYVWLTMVCVIGRQVCGWEGEEYFEYECGVYQRCCVGDTHTLSNNH